jgi:hypothetical protein
LAAARTWGNAFFIAWAHSGCGRTYMESDPVRALNALRVGLGFARETRVVLFEAIILREAAGLEAVHGDLDRGLALFEQTLDSFQRSDNVPNLAGTLASLVVVFQRLEMPDLAATVYGGTTPYPGANIGRSLAEAVEHLRTVLGSQRFGECVAIGAAMDLGEAVRYARDQIQLARAELVSAP